MNLASWIILAIVVAILVLAIRSTFFKRSDSGRCGGDHDDAGGPRESTTDTAGCSGCGGKSCDTCAVSSTMLQPRIIPLDPPSRD